MYETSRALSAFAWLFTGLVVFLFFLFFPTSAHLFSVAVGLGSPPGPAATAEVEVPAALAVEAAEAAEVYASTGVWPSALRSADATGRAGEVSLELVPVDGSPFCAEGSFPGSGYSYYYSASAAGPVEAGVHPGSCSEGAAGSGGAPAVDVDVFSLDAVSAPAEPTDWTGVVWVGSVAGGLVLVGGAGLGLYAGASRVRAARRRELDARAVLSERWGRAQADLAALRAESYRVESDVLARLDFPVLFDPADDLSAAWVAAHARVIAADLEVPPLHDGALVERFEELVVAARAAWAAAWANAERLSLSRLSVVERSRVVRARKLLAQALDPGRSALERRAFYDRALSLLEGILVVPLEVRAELESVIRPELPSAL